MAEAKKVLIWIGGVCGIVGGIGTAAWIGTGFAAGHREAATAYKEVEALGIPLDADAFLASFSPTPSENCAEELLPALADLRATAESFRGEKKTHPDTFVWNKSEDTVSIEERKKAIGAYKKSMDRVRAASNKPFCVPQQDWADSVNVIFPEYAGLRIAAKLSCTEAVTVATLGNRKLAVQRLKEAVHYGNLSGQTPTLIGALVHIAITTIVTTAVRECIIADPAGSETYAQVLDQVKLKPFGYALRGEIYFNVAFCRNYNVREAFGTLQVTDHDTPKRLTNPKRSGLPSDPAMRAFMGYSLTRWLPVIRQLNPDGTSKNEVAFDAAFARFEKETESESGPISAFHGTLLPVFSSAMQAYVSVDAHLAVADAFSKVVTYYVQNGKYPKTLSQAGVTKTDPFSDKNKPLGYSVKDGQMRVWSIGQNKVDDNGLTDREASARDERETNEPSYRNGDIAFVMRPPGTMVHP